MFTKFKILKDAIMANDMEATKKTINDSLTTIHNNSLQTVRENTFEVLVWGEKTLKNAKSKLSYSINKSKGGE